jgi:hypothetical protein
MNKVYLASPYSIGNQEENVKRQIDVANKLMDMGWVPYVPLLSHYQNLICPRPYQDWIDFDCQWLRVCDCVLRLDGESKGADQEVEMAIAIGMPVYYSIDELNGLEKGI